MLEHSSHPITLGWKNAPQDRGHFTDVRTCSVTGTRLTTYATTGAEFVLDSVGRTVTLVPHAALSGSQYIDLGELQPAFAAARAYMSDEAENWKFFSMWRAEDVEGADTIGTAVVSRMAIRSNVPPVDKEVRELFGRLVSEWKEYRDTYSSGVEMFIHPSYQAIIGMGEKVLPLIFEELRRELDHWFWALKAITRYDAVPSEHVGNLAQMRDYWLAWATKNGYQWQANFTSTRYFGKHFPR